MSEAQDSSYARTSGEGNIEDKLDEDFLFYLTFTKNYFSNLIEAQDIDLCRAWLEKLCGEQMQGIQEKRTRNVYLSNLVLDMQEGQLKGPFLQPPPVGSLPSENGIFCPVQEYIPTELPSWMKEALDGTGDAGVNFTHHSRDGRVYLASKSLDSGRGAFGYLAVTVAGQDDGWFNLHGAGNVRTSPTRKIHNKPIPNYPKHPEIKYPLTAADAEGLDTRKVLTVIAQRCSEPKRRRLVRFYDDMIKSINEELQGHGQANAHACQLVAQLQNDPSALRQIPEMNHMGAEERRHHLLNIVSRQAAARRKEVQNRGEALDKLEETVIVPEDVGEEDELDMEAWRTQCRTDFKDRNVKALLEIYPRCLVERFMELIMDERLKAVKKEQKRFRQFSSEVKRDLKEIVEDGLKKYSQARGEWLEVSPLVDECRRRLLQREQEAREKNEQASKESKTQGANLAENTKHLEVLLAELKKADEDYNNDFEETDRLRARIEAEHKRLSDLSAACHSAGDEDLIERARLSKAIESMKVEIKGKQARINELTEMLKNK